MKKRIRKTGEIVDVISYSKYSSTSRNSDLDWVSYIDSRGQECEEKGLNIYWDFDDVEEVPDTNIEWFPIRIKTAISLLTCFVNNRHNSGCIIDDNTLAKWSVGLADALIAELKKGVENEKH